MVPDDVQPAHIDRALLCLSDTDIDVALRRLVFGKPLIFHIIKNLQAVDIHEIAVSAETIPPELPALVDQLGAQRIAIRLLRNGPEAMRFAAQPGRLLLQNAATWVARSCLQQLLDRDRKLILTLPEDPDFSEFERIDLNRRWAGVALIDGKLAEGLGEMPEGWSMDSFLLRSALQAGYPDRVIVTEKPADDVVIHARAPAAEDLLVKRLQPMSRDHGLLEQACIRVADAAINRFAGEKWWEVAADLTPPIAAALSAISAFSGYAIISLWLGAFALFASIVRSRAREVAYRGLSADWVLAASTLLLLTALFFSLAGLVVPLEAGFLALSLFGLSATAQLLRGSGPQLFLSPLVVSIWLAAMASAGFAVIAVKLAISALIGAQLWQAFQRES